METDVVLAIVGGALLGGIVAGFSGFGTGLVTLGIWLHVMDPRVAVPLVAVCGSASHLSSLRQRLREGVAGDAWPLVFSGLAGVPIGLMLLSVIDASAFKRALGIVILTIVGAMLIAAHRRAPGLVREQVDPAGVPTGTAFSQLATLGLVGGVLGGLAGLSGALPALWAQFHDWNKTRQRAMFQVFNLSILLLALVGYALSGYFTAQVLLVGVIAVPASLAGAWIGRRLFGFADERMFRRIVQLLLCVSALRLIALPT